MFVQNAPLQEGISIFKYDLTPLQFNANANATVINYA